MSTSESSPQPPFSPVDPYEPIMSSLGKMEALLPIDLQMTPASGHGDEPLRFLCSLRKTRECFRQQETLITHQLDNARGVARIIELKLLGIQNVVLALEQVIGEARARCRARGLPLYPPGELFERPYDEVEEIPSDGTKTPGVAITPNSA